MEKNRELKLVFPDFDINELFANLIIIDANLYKRTNKLEMFIGSNYWYFNQQGATSIFNNPIDMLQSSKLAPKPDQISKVEELTSISDSDKEHTIFIVYKFGCPHCQQLWLFANQNTDLLPSENVKWIPTSDENKNKSDLINQVESYPAIIYWDKIDNQLKERILIQPSKSELNGILIRLKEYKK